MTITANELKVKGVSVLEQNVDNNQGAIISVRGKDKYIVLTIEDYNKLRELELEAAINETKNDIASGNIMGNDIEEHMNRVLSV